MGQNEYAITVRLCADGWSPAFYEIGGSGHVSYRREYESSILSFAKYLRGHMYGT